MKPRRVGMTARIAENEAKLCRSCLTRNRTSISPWCWKCRSRVDHHGDPKGKVIPLTAYRNEQREIYSFYRKWQGSAQVKACLKLFED